MTPLKAIKAKCLDCSAGQPKEVRLCPVEDCPLYSFRFGKGKSRVLSDKERERMSTMAKKNFAKKHDKLSAKPKENLK